MLFVVLGVLLQVGGFAVAVSSGLKTAQAVQDLRDAHGRLSVAAGAFRGDVQNCAVQGGGLPCLHVADEKLAQSFDDFAEEVSTISFPGTLDASPLLADAHHQSFEISTGS